MYYEQTPNAPTGFALVQTVTDDNTDLDEFGYAVGVSGTMLLVGAPNYQGAAGDRTGVVCQFKYIGASWQQLGKIHPVGA